MFITLGAVVEFEPGVVIIGLIVDIVEDTLSVSPHFLSLENQNT